MKNRIILLSFGILAMILISCNQEKASEALPILGHQKIEGTDTIAHTIPDFRLLNHDSLWITNETFDDKIYIADFFFTSCPTICPRVKKEMLRIYDQFIDSTQLYYLSHSIDYRRDSIPRLKEYKENLEIEDRWHFVEVPKDDLEELAYNYMSIAYEDKDAPGGYDHSPYIILVDKDRHIRSFCNGTESEEVDKFMKDIEKLLREK